jgi:hypothetical protein
MHTMSAVRGRSKNLLRSQIFSGEAIVAPCSAGAPLMYISDTQKTKITECNHFYQDQDQRETSFYTSLITIS